MQQASASCLLRLLAAACMFVLLATAPKLIADRVNEHD